jgi:hypothetical protein
VAPYNDRLMACISADAQIWKIVELWSITVEFPFGLVLATIGAGRDMFWSVAAAQLRIKSNLFSGNCGTCSKYCN